MTDPVDKRAAEIRAERVRRQQSLEDHTDYLVRRLEAEAGAATKYPLTVEVEAQGLVIVSYWKEMFANKIQKEVAQLHVPKGKGAQCEIVFAGGVWPPANFKHGISYDFDDAAEFVMFATIGSMAQSVAAGCAIVAQDIEVHV